MSRVIVLQHTACETLGSIADALGGAGHATDVVPSFAGHPVPEKPGRAAGLVVMGGPMSVYEQDRYAFLKDELRLIEETLAASLGATVHAGPKKEIGWYSLQLSDEGRSDLLFSWVPPAFTGFHWHSDGFDVPRNCTNFASSERTACQAFRHGTLAYGVLFHGEVTKAMIGAMVDTFSQELDEAGIRGNDILEETDICLPGIRDVASPVFRNWARLIPESED